jgi:glutathione S-transferase
LLLSQIGKSYQRIPVEIFRGEAKTPEFLAKNPAAEVPVLELDDGRCIAESNAILWHLARGTPFLSNDSFEQTETLRWLLFEQSGVEPIVGSARFWILTGRAAARRDELARRLEIARRSLGVLNGVLASRSFFVGERYSIADVALYAYTHVAPDAGIDLDPWPNVKKWIARVEAQPGYIAGPEPYSAAAQV